LLPLLLPCLCSHSPALIHVCLLSFASSCSPALVPPLPIPLLSFACSHLPALIMFTHPLICVRLPSFMCICPLGANESFAPVLPCFGLHLAFVWACLGSSGLWLVSLRALRPPVYVYTKYTISTYMLINTLTLIYESSTYIRSID